MREPTGKARGGLARAASLTPEQRRAIAKKGADARKELASLPKATHGSADRPLKIGDIEIPCYVLEDDTRVLSQRGLLSGLGMVKGSTRSGDDQLTVLANGLRRKGFANNEIVEVIKNPIRFRAPHGGRAAYGYPATILVDICEAVLVARKAGKLLPRQSNIADQCEVLVRGFARVGIIALVDEATGYQKDRARDALAKILEAFVAKELQPWVKKFPAEFYEEMFRLRGLPFNPDSVKRPPYFGHLTNDIVYRRLAPGVWKELKARSRKNSEGRPTHQLHRLLTPEVGDPRLRDLLMKVITVMQLSDKWGDFKSKLDRVVPAYDETLKLPFELENDTGEGL
ncbi:MAG TPA: hypothetical protein ENI68_01070 [Gammaproteobacteria bacterium]|nr:hypothetical protein [Gammaproteobacteria bacterium]